MWHTKRQESMGHSQEKLISRNCPQESFGLLEKGFKLTIFILLKELKEAKGKKSHQIENMNTEKL